MLKFTPSISGIKTESIIRFLIDNLNNVSASINSILTQVRSNSNFSSDNAKSITNASIGAWTTANRPTSTVNTNVIGINTTTGNLNYTTDNGATWSNYDGTAA